MLRRVYNNEIEKKGPEIIKRIVSIIFKKRYVTPLDAFYTCIVQYSITKSSLTFFNGHDAACTILYATCRYIQGASQSRKIVHKQLINLTRS